MDIFFRKLFERRNFLPPYVCLEALNKEFPDARHVDWYEKDNFFEAIFYKNNCEHIATFDTTGKLLEFKVNLHQSKLPQPLRNILNTKGEIMSVVWINSLSKNEYECIVRDHELYRYLIRLSDKGEVLEGKKL